MRGVRPRPLGFVSGLGCSFERLVFPEVGNAQAQGIDRNEFVGDVGFEKEHKIRGVKIALQLAMVGGRVVDHVEVHARAKGWCLHLFACDFLHVHIDFGRGSVRDELLDDVILPVDAHDDIRWEIREGSNRERCRT